MLYVTMMKINEVNIKRERVDRKKEFPLKIETKV